MGAVQTTYSNTIAKGFEGEVADLALSDVLSFNSEVAGGIAFGRAVVVGTADKSCKIAQAGAFLGVSVRDITLPPSRGDVYAQGDSVAVMSKGLIWVKVTEAVNYGDAPYRANDGTFNKTAGGTNTAIANGRYESSAAANGLALLRLL